MNTEAKLAEYVHFKPVQAGKIVKIEPPTVPGARMAHLYLEGQKPGETILQPVHDTYLKKHNPEPGGWFVREASGNVAYYSAAAFEDQFACVPDPQPISAEQMADIELLAGQQWTQADHLALLHRVGQTLIGGDEPLGLIAECKQFRRDVLGDISTWSE